MNITDFLVSIRRINKMHESMLKEICEEYELSLLEANIISFLHNHPSKDTARDIGIWSLDDASRKQWRY